MPANRRLNKIKETDHRGVSARSKVEADLEHGISEFNPQVQVTQPARTSAGWLLSLQRTLGNQVVQRILAKRTIRSQQDNVIQRWWDEYTVKFGEWLADNKKIKIFDDRLDHILERHGPDVKEESPDFYTFTTSKKNVIRNFVQKALDSGTVYKGVGGAFDFEYKFDHPIGKNNEGNETSVIRVIVVELGKSGKLGKVQTAYPI